MGDLAFLKVNTGDIKFVSNGIVSCLTRELVLTIKSVAGPRTLTWSCDQIHNFLRQSIATPKT